ncbi:hypothetical protein [Roseovarius rhodophyticola]|uniref:Uncharacterized protein n=1 Tax=Roseovarius rhodophyticola TaxID=3080827 RepID=A0ABZ2TE63_9RHOB|nr:hypothetical protein [Roseovarius sp. W115]MDV2928259.1 hypothetical protein [Roseovarius sp. W115]
MTLTITASGNRGASGGWVRPMDEAHRILVPTVAHILYDRSGRLRSRVRIAGMSARVHALVRLPSLSNARADAALVEPDRDWAAPRVASSRGHLNEFIAGLAVQCCLPDGGHLSGRMLSSDWAGRMRYSFGTRNVFRQWIIAVDRKSSEPGTRPIRRGDSGLLWHTPDGVAVGLQIGVLATCPDRTIITPFTTICDLFEVRTAA